MNACVDTKPDNRTAIYNSPHFRADFNVCFKQTIKQVDFSLFLYCTIYCTHHFTETSSLLPPGLPSLTIDRTVSSELFGFCFYLFFLFRSTLSPHGAVSVPHSRTALGKRRPSVVGAITFNQWSAFISDSEESDS